MLDADLAALYGVPTKALIQAVQRNLSRFPADFMFRLTRDETEDLRSQIVTSNSTRGRGGRRYAPYAFTEQGVAMLSSVLRSRRAIKVNVAIMRTFVRLRQMLAAHEGLARKLDALEEKYDANFKVVFDAIRELMSPPIPGRLPIGFRPRSRSDPESGERGAKAPRPQHCAIRRLATAPHSKRYPAAKSATARLTQP
jgi:hypothetical protein